MYINKNNKPGVMPTILPPHPNAAPGVMPTIEPPPCPSISTTSPVSIASGVVFVKSAEKSHFPSLPATDHGRGFGAINGVRTMPFVVVVLMECCSISKLLFNESLLGDRVFESFVVGVVKRSTDLPSPPDEETAAADGCVIEFGSVCILTSGDLRPITGEHFSKLSVDRDRGVHDTPFSNGELRSNLIGLRSSSIGVVSSDVR